MSVRHCTGKKKAASNDVSDVSAGVPKDVQEKKLPYFCSLLPQLHVKTT